MPAFIANTNFFPLSFKCVAQRRKLTIRPAGVIPPEQFQLLTIEIHSTSRESRTADGLGLALDRLRNATADQPNADQT